MFARRPPGLDDHPDVAPIERILTLASERSARPLPTRGGRVMADGAVWLCACIYDDDVQTPTWIIYDAADGSLGWQRLPPGRTEFDLVDSALMTGDHVTPESVLAWLRGVDDQYWPGVEDADRAVFADLGLRIRELVA